MFTLLIADDHPLYRDALKGALISNFKELRMLEAGNLHDTLQLVDSNDVDLLLLDLHMPGSCDLFGLIHVRKLYPELPVAVVSGLEDKDIVSKVINTGAMGFIPKTTSSAEIASAVQSILDGDTWVPSALMDDIAEVDEAFAELA